MEGLREGDLSGWKDIHKDIRIKRRRSIRMEGLREGYL